MSYLNLITFYSNHSLDKDRVLLPKVLLFLKSASGGIENNNITRLWIPGKQQVVLLSTFDPDTADTVYCAYLANL